MIALTSDPLIPRNSAKIMRDHPKQLEINKLRTYALLSDELKLANYHNDVEKIEALRQEFVNNKAKIQQLYDQIVKEMFANVNIVFNPRESINDNDLIHFRPDLQIFVDVKFYNKVNVWKALSQVTI